MAKWRTLFGALALLFTAGTFAQGDSYPKLSGIWKGSYSYRDGSGLNEVEFDIHLAQRGQSLVGRIVEPNTFKRSSTPSLFANIVGIIDGRRLRFIKTYDGTGGENHSVYYEGELNADGSAIAGIWIIESRWRGAFKAVRRDSAGGK